MIACPAVNGFCFCGFIFQKSQNAMFENHLQPTKKRQAIIAGSLPLVVGVALGFVVLLLGFKVLGAFTPQFSPIGENAPSRAHDTAKGGVYACGGTCACLWLYRLS